MDFDVEKFREYIESEEGKDWWNTFRNGLGLKNQVEIEETIKARVDASTSGIVKNRDKWKEEAMQWKEQAELGKKVSEVLHDVGIGVDNDGKVLYDRLEDELAKLKSSGEGGDPEKVVELERQLRKTSRDYETKIKEMNLKVEELKALEEGVQERDNFISRVLIENEIRSQLVKNEYPAEIVNAVIPHLKNVSKAVVQYDEDTNDRKAVTDDGRSVEEWVKWWKETDEGKALRLAPLNTGGGSPGKGGGSQTKPWKDMSAQERAELYNRNPELYRKRRAEYDRQE